MHRLLTVMLVAVVGVVAMLPTADALRCYMCQGYDSKYQDDSTYNNKYCTLDKFDSGKVNTVSSTECMTLVQYLPDGTEFTIRSPSAQRDGKEVMKAKANNNYIQFSGYFCNLDRCNGQRPANAAPATSALCMPLLLLSLLAASHRLLA